MVRKLGHFLAPKMEGVFDPKIFHFLEKKSCRNFRNLGGRVRPNVPRNGVVSSLRSDVFSLWVVHRRVRSTHLRTTDSDCELAKEEPFGFSLHTDEAGAQRCKPDSVCVIDGSRTVLLIVVGDPVCSNSRRRKHGMYSRRELGCVNVSALYYSPWINGNATRTSMGA